jgi:hypothetical protein
MTPLDQTPTQELLNRLVQQSKELVQAEVALARAELRADVRREARMVGGLSVAAVCGLCMLNLLLVALALGIGESVPPWAGALLVAAGVLVLGTLFGLVGWALRAKQPLQRTLKTLKEDVRWAKQRIA